MHVGFFLFWGLSTQPSICLSDWSHYTDFWALVTHRCLSFKVPLFFKETNQCIPLPLRQCKFLLLLLLLFLGCWRDGFSVPMQRALGPQSYFPSCFFTVPGYIFSPFTAPAQAWSHIQRFLAVSQQVSRGQKGSFHFPFILLPHLFQLTWSTAVLTPCASPPSLF